MVKALKNYNGQMTVKAFTLSAVSCPNVSCFVSAVSSFFCDGILFKVVFFFQSSPPRLQIFLAATATTTTTTTAMMTTQEILTIQTEVITDPTYLTPIVSNSGGSSA